MLRDETGKEELEHSGRVQGGTARQLWRGRIGKEPTRRVRADGSHMNLSEVTVASTGSELVGAGDEA